MLHTDDIWAELTRRRIKATEIANDLGVATSTVTRAINGETRAPASVILEHIAARIGVGVEELSPGRPAHLTQEHNEKSSLGSTSNRRAGWTSRATRGGGQRSKGTPLDGVHRVSAGASRTSAAAKEAA